MVLTVEKKKAPKVGTISTWEIDRETAHKTPDNIMPTIPGAYIRTKRKGKRHYYYLQVIQRDGQMAWSSPVWISAVD